MDPISLAILAGGAIFKGISALSARHKAKKMQKEGESYLKQAAKKEQALGAPPKMEIPKSVDQYINLARTMARQELPGAAQMRQDIAQTNAATLSTASQVGSGADTMAAVLSAGQNKMRALNQLGIAAAEYTAGKQSEYGQAIASRAPWENQMWQQNQFYPWQVGKNEAMDQRNIGLQMKYQGMDMASAAGTQFWNGLSQDAWSFANNPYTNQAFQGFGGPKSNPMAVSQGMNNPLRPTYTPPSGQYDNNLGDFLNR